MRPPFSMLPVALAAALLVSAGSARAGFFLVHEAEMPNPMTQQVTKQRVRSWHEGKKFKRENPLRNETVIIDLDNDQVVGLNTEKKTYWKITPDKYRQLAMVSLAVMGVQMAPNGQINVPDNLLTPTGKVKSVGAWQSHEVRVNMKAPKGMKMETSFWLSEDVELPIDKMIDELRIALNDPRGPAYKKLFEQWRDQAGYPVQSVTTIQTPKGTVVTKETLLSYERKKIPDDEFSIPEGYSKTIDPITQLEGMQRQMKRRLEDYRKSGGKGPGMPAAPGRKQKKRVLPAKPVK